MTKLSIRKYTVDQSSWHYLKDLGDLEDSI